MPSGYVIRKNQYYDSVFLMRVAKTLLDEPGVNECAVLMATDANKERLVELGIHAEDVAAAGLNDLVVAIQADEDALITRLLGEIEQRLSRPAITDQATVFRSMEAAAAAFPQANLAVISVPGEFAAREARKALEAGKHVFLFSDNVPIEQEVELKQLARARNRLVMGPDCGTSLIGGIGIGFANRVRRGPVGVVGASGTGIQEFTSLIHQAGSGISHAIGTGTHDLSDAVGGITTLMGLDALEADPATQVITIISKPAGQGGLRLLQERIQQCKKPVVGCLLGVRQPMDCGSNFQLVRTIDQAVVATFAALGENSLGHQFRSKPTETALLNREVRSWRPEQRYLRGLFAGGTFCFQAQQVLREAGIPVYSSTPIDQRYRLENPEESLEHSLIDMGDDFFTQGKPHPMIDSGERHQRILREASDPEVAILLLDFILGESASLDPVGDLLKAIRQAKETRQRMEGNLSVVAFVCGTDLDQQNLGRQKEMLSDVGAILANSCTQAAEYCRDLIQTAGERYG